MYETESQMTKPRLINPATAKPLREVMDKLVDDQGREFPRVGGAYRFVEGCNYTDNFGLQWNKFEKTQIDREARVSQSRDRFFAVTGWDKLDLSGENVLEVGSGAGRFTQVVLDHTRANLYSVDYSNAVEANFRNNGHHGERLHLFQASIYELPFAAGSFDRVFCFGVLQHTPDFRASIQALARMVRPGGELVVDFYPIRGWWTKIQIKYMLRPLAKRLKHETLLNLIEKNANWMTVAGRLFRRLRVAPLTNRFIPICDIDGTFPSGLTREQVREWVILDTFDMFAPEYDQPQRVTTVRKWFEESGVRPTFAGFLTYGEKNRRVAVVKGVRE